MTLSSPTLPDFAADADLVALARRRDEDALHQLFARHHRAALAVAGRHLHQPADIDDAVAEAFARVFERLDQLRDPLRFRAFLLATVRNIAHDRWRSADRTVPGLTEVPNGTGPTVESTIEQADDQRRLREAVETLPRRQRTAIRRFYWDEAPVAIIARELGLSANATTQLLFRARANLATRTSVVCRRERRR